MLVEKRTKIITLRVCPTLYEKAQQKLEAEYHQKVENAKNKKMITKTSISDIVEQILINMVD